MRALSQRKCLAACGLVMAGMSWAQSAKTSFPETNWTTVKPEEEDYSSEKLEVLRVC
ncbi:hypothetical protein [Bryobacter aggregatus]|uniref:hypothetical protein n=1 Tax=Bryobacter aggregatus TaxID=360054 RepID=UPI0012BAB30E|nr:hypothetical protein [Bryobacter aggregatus]